MTIVRSSSTIAVLTAAFAALATPISAAPELPPERLLLGAKVAESNACSVIKIDFNSQLKYLSHTPAGRSDELRIILSPVEKGASARSDVVNQESLRAPQNERASVHAIEFVYEAKGAALSVYFKRNVFYKIAQEANLKSLLIAVSGTEPSAACEPVFDDAAVAIAGAGQGGSDASAPAGLPGDGTIAMMPEVLDQLMIDARAALMKGDGELAMRLLNTAARSTDTRYVEESRELIGLAREKLDQLDAARTEYKGYLAVYPKGPGADRVRGRLMALEHAQKQNPNQSGTFAEIPLPAARAGVPINDGAIARDATGGKAWDTATSVAPARIDPGAWTVTQYGSISAYYNRNQGGRDFYVPPKLQLGWDKENVYQTYQNSVLGALDYGARFENSDFIGKLKVSASRDNRYLYGQTDVTAVSAAYVDGEHKDSGLSARVGRQTRFSGGVLGRFDGALAGFRAASGVKLNAVAGSPVERSRDRPFLHDSFFYGISVDFDRWRKDFETSIYFIDQQTDGILDRQAIGAEFRYHRELSSVFGTVDYDIHYQQLNNVILTGAYNFPDFSSVGLSLDYRRAPLIFTTNALQGQGIATLSELLNVYTQTEIERFALDRTAESYSAAANYLVPLGEHLQFVADAAVTYMSGTKESGNVPGSQSSGTEFYGLAQLNRTDLITEGDYVSAGFRFGETALSRRYGFELSARYPVTKDWQVGPVMRMGFVDFKAANQDEYQLMPSLRTSYYLTNDVVLEFELGKKWIERDTIHGIESETELMVLSGIRYDFHRQH